MGYRATWVQLPAAPCSYTVITVCKVSFGPLFVAWYNRYETLVKGINVGGWLVAERWMTPALFKG